MNDQRPPEMPRLGAEGEACAACHAPLAVDQRYCLQCGERRGATRVDLAALRPSEVPQVPREAVVQSGPGVPQQGPWTPLALVGSIATLGLMLLVGVMIGKDDSPTQLTAAAAPAAPAAAAPADPVAAAGGAGAAADGKGAEGGGDISKNVSGKGGGKADETAPASSAPGAETIDEGALDALEGATGQDAADASKNLPDTIALPGEPPPVDNEAPGGGTDAEVIK